MASSVLIPYSCMLHDSPHIWSMTRRGPARPLQFAPWVQLGSCESASEIHRGSGSRGACCKISPQKETCTEPVDSCRFINLIQFLHFFQIMDVDNMAWCLFLRHLGCGPTTSRCLRLVQAALAPLGPRSQSQPPVLPPSSALAGSFPGRISRDKKKATLVLSNRWCLQTSKNTSVFQGVSNG